MSVGIDILDTDHKIIVQYMNKFIDAVDREESTFHIDSIYQQLLSYTIYHFEREERILEVCNYDNLPAHHETHEILKKELNSLRNRYMQTSEKIIDTDIRDLLNKWLFEHILEDDHAYRTTIENNADLIRNADI